MKKIVYTGVAALLIGLGSIKLPAQTTTTTNINTDDKSGKVKIEMTIVDDDGQVQHINEEYDLNDVSEEEIMAKLQALEGLDIDMDDKNVKVIVKKGLAGDPAKNLRFNQNMEMNNVAFLGVTGYTINADGEGPQQVRFTKVIKDKPAYKAGLRNEDILVSFDGQQIKTYDELVEAIHAKKPIDEVEVKVLREGKQRKFNVTLGEHQVPKFPRAISHSLGGDNLRFVEVDMEVENLNDDDRELVKRSTGLELNDKNTINDADLDVFPNPGNRDFSYTLRLKDGGELNVKVLDQSGKEIINQILNTENGVYEGKLNLDKVPNGTYLLIFKHGDKLLSEKLIKS